MKQTTKFVLALCALLSLSACAAPAPSASGSEVSENAASSAYQKISAEEAKKKMDQGGYVVVDVRTAAEYEQAHVPGALLVPNETIQTNPPAQLPEQDARLIVYCRTGVRSKQAADKLIKMGYQHIYDMGGIVSWPYETQSGAALS